MNKGWFIKVSIGGRFLIWKGRFNFPKNWGQRKIKGWVLKARFGALYPLQQKFDIRKLVVELNRFDIWL